MNTVKHYVKSNLNIIILWSTHTLEGRESAQWKCRKRWNKRKWHSIWRPARLLLCTKRIKTKVKFQQKAFKTNSEYFRPPSTAHSDTTSLCNFNFQGKQSIVKRTSMNNVFNNCLWNGYSNISAEEWIMLIYLECSYLLLQGFVVKE